MGKYEFRFDGVRAVQEQNYQANQGEFVIAVRGENDIRLQPQKRIYATGSPMTEAAIDSTLGRDLYVSLGDDLGAGAWSVRLYLRSFVACIWLGAF